MYLFCIYILHIFIIYFCIYIIYVIYICIYYVYMYHVRYQLPDSPRSTSLGHFH